MVAPMVNFLPPPLIGIVAGLVLLLNTLLWTPPLLLLALAKLLLPFQAVRRRLDPLLIGVAEGWLAGNIAWMRRAQRTDWDVAGVDGVEAKRWYLINCNHQSWVDILVLQYLLTGRIPFLKFFVKQQLIWVPLLGLAWWALDLPFMRRHSEEELKKRPELRRADQEATRVACEKVSLIPTSVVNFCEGTRFTPLKHRRQQSPYRHLLRPKTGGIALALNVMGDKFHAILDVTVVYPDGVPTFWDFLCNRLRRVRVRMRSLPVPRDLARGDYANDPAVRQAFRDWLEAIWQHKDREIDALLDSSSR